MGGRCRKAQALHSRCLVNPFWSLAKSEVPACTFLPAVECPCVYRTTTPPATLPPTYPLPQAFSSMTLSCTEDNNNQKRSSNTEESRKSAGTNEVCTKNREKTVSLVSGCSQDGMCVIFEKKKSRQFSLMTKHLSLFYSVKKTKSHRCLFRNVNL